MTKKSFKNLLLSGVIYLSFAVSALFNFPAQAAAQIQPFELILSWSTNTYTPFNYSGKALPVYGSIIKVVVAPLSKPNVNLETLEYNWVLDEEPQNAASGINKQEFFFQVKKTDNDSHLVKTYIRNQDNSFVRQLQIEIPIAAPEIVIYPFDPDTAKAEAKKPEQIILEPDSDISFSGLPYFFTIKKAEDLKYQWTFQNQTVLQTEKSGIFNLKIGPGELSTAITQDLKIYAQNSRNLLQMASDKIKIVIMPK